MELLTQERHMMLLRNKEFVMKKIHPQFVLNRKQVLESWILRANFSLKLKWKTIELAIRLFDYYCEKKYEQAERQGLRNSRGHTPHILENKSESILVATTCFFSAAKYNEIYPPLLNDFTYFESETLTNLAVVKKEIDVINVTQVNYTIALVSDWFEVLAWRDMPDWGYVCLLHAPFVGAEELSRTIFQVSQYESYGKGNSECVTAVLEHLKLKIPNCLLRSSMTEKKKKEEEKKKLEPSNDHQ